MFSPGKRLRELRLERWGMKNEDGRRITIDGRRSTKEYMAEYAGISTKSLTEIEDGVTKQPARKTIDLILDILGQFHEIDWVTRQSISAAYGYKLPVAPPTQIEGQWARHNWEKANSEIWFPAYLVDIIHRLWGWNKFAPRLLGLSPSDAKLTRFAQVDILDVLFKLSSSYVEIVNRDEYIPSLIVTMKAQFQPYLGEIWYTEWVKEAQNRYPEFRRLWSEIDDEEILPYAMGNPTPIKIRIKSALDILKFQLMAVGFANDPRFIVAQWIPVDEFTALQCLLWKKQMDG